MSHENAKNLYYSCLYEKKNTFTACSAIAMKDYLKTMQGFESQVLTSYLDQI